MKANGTTWIIIGGIALLMLIGANNASGTNTPPPTSSPLPDGAVFNLSNLDGTYGSDNVQRLTNLYYVLDNTTDPISGNQLSTTQIQLMLAQALQETGLFTSVANTNLVDNYNNYAGIKGNSRYAAGPDGTYAQYPSIPAFVSDWMLILSKGTQPLEATNVNDYVAGLVSFGYFEDTPSTYQNDMQAYYNTLQSTAV